MNGPDILSGLRAELADAVIARGNPPPARPLVISPWISMSLLQKAIRRGHEELALRAAATLLLHAPDRLWRCCGVIAFEDVGTGDLDAVYLATASLAGKRFRARLGGEWAVASFIVSRLASAPKCRAADDLLLAAESHPAHATARSELPAYATPDLLRIATGSGPLPVRALALWFALGTDRRPSKKLQARRGEPNAVFDGLCEAGLPHTAVEIAREGFRRIGEVLCPFVALLCPAMQGEGGIIRDDDLPPEAIIRSIPGWAYDVYSREGQRAFHRFLNQRNETARWVRAHIPLADRVGFLGGIVFRIEGGLVRARLRWATADELRRQVDIECHGPACPDASEVLDLMRADLPLLNEARRHVY